MGNNQKIIDSPGRGRPRLRRRIRHRVQGAYFKPRGIPLKKLSAVDISREELEALRLRYVQDLDQTEAAEYMKTSQSTFQRILHQANRKVSQALVKGQAIHIVDRLDSPKP